MPKLDSDVDLNSDIRILMVEGGSYRGALLRIRILLMVDCFVSFRFVCWRDLVRHSQETSNLADSCITVSI